MLLDNLLVTGRLDYNTPLSVILEICKCQFIELNIDYTNDDRYIQNLIDHIHSKSKIDLNDTKSENNRKFLGHFINPEEKWEYVRLLEAYEFFISFSKTRSIPKRFSYGLQSNKNTGSLNACVMYRICKDSGLSLSRSTKMEEMYRQLVLFNEPREELIKLIRLDTLSKAELIKLIKIEENPTDTVTEKGIRESMKKKLDYPKTNCDAVVLCAKNYKLDISKEKSPFLEYKRVLSGNREYPNLTKSFNPLLPIELYTGLSELLKSEGIYDTPDEIGYSLLQEIYSGKNFYIGKREGCSRNTCVYFRDLQEKILCYGILGKELQTYSFEGLYDLIKTTKRLNDITGQPFERIKKLKLICIEYKENKLFQLINNIESQSLEISKRVKELLKRDSVKRYVRFIFNLGMYMRGWDGKGAYPLRSAGEIDENRLISLFMQYDSLDKTDAMHLPLVNYKNGEFQFSTDTFDGITINDRVQIVRNGESIDTMASCVKWTSNWFISSGYYYLNLIGETPNYDPDSVVRIG